MRCYQVLILTGAVLTLLSVPCLADVHTRTNLSAQVATDGQEGPRYVALSVPRPTVSDPNHILYAEISFQANLEDGVEVELWKDPGGGVRPWSTENDQRLNIWITNNRSPGLVRFDVTDLLREWCRAQTDGEVLLRLASNQTVEDLDLASVPGFKLRYHVVSRD